MRHVALALLLALYAPSPLLAKQPGDPSFRAWQATMERARAIAMLIEFRFQTEGAYPVIPLTHLSPELLSAVRGPSAHDPPLFHASEDAWDHPIHCVSDSLHYVVWSNGSDGVRDSAWSATPIPFNPACDVVLVDGWFIHAPEELCCLADDGRLQALLAIALELVGRVARSPDW